MKAILIIILVLIVLSVLYALSLKGRSGTDLSAFGKFYFTHRGLYKSGYIPENSIAAFRAAKERGFGIELDVHLIADGNLAVMHDSSLMRTAGADRMLYDLSSAELGMYYLEGTSETIPSFSDVLEEIDGSVPLIIELKVDKNNYAELCRTVCDALKDYKGLYCLESFDPRCVYWLAENRPEWVRGQLAENYFKREKKIPFIGKLFLTSLVFNFLGKPDFIAYRYSDRRDIPYKICKKLWKMPIVSWTVKSEDELNIAVNDNEIPIFEGFIPE